MKDSEIDIFEFLNFVLFVTFMVHVCFDFVVRSTQTLLSEWMPGIHVGAAVF
jgi:hypothetical protein